MRQWSFWICRTSCLVGMLLVGPAWAADPPAKPAPTVAPATPAAPAAPTKPTKPPPVEEVYYSIDPDTQAVEVNVVKPNLFDEAPKLQTGDEIFIRGKEGYQASHGPKLWTSSTRVQWPGEGTLANLIDGSLETRWSSDYKDNQEITIEFAKVEEVLGLKINWERAAAKHWLLLGSDDGQTWRTLKEIEDGKEGPRVEEITLNEKLRGLRLKLLERATAWGFSIFEIEVVTPASLAAAEQAKEAAAAAATEAKK